METVKKMTSDQSAQESNIAANQRRIEEHEFILAKFQKRADIEAEYGNKLAKMDTKLSDQVVKLQTNIVELESKVALSEKRGITLSMTVDNMQNRLELYLGKLRQDIDNVTG